VKATIERRLLNSRALAPASGWINTPVPKTTL
jgi:hypothetical protein